MVALLQSWIEAESAPLVIVQDLLGLPRIEIGQTAGPPADFHQGLD